MNLRVTVTGEVEVLSTCAIVEASLNRAHVSGGRRETK